MPERRRTRLDHPVACSLSAPEFRARRDLLLSGLRRDCLDQRSLPNGLAMRFAPTPGQLARITEVIELERQCCRFLEMRLTVSDPTTWEKPWTVLLPMRPTDGELIEYACHEGNYAMANILRAARVAEGAGTAAEVPNR